MAPTSWPLLSPVLPPPAASAWRSTNDADTSNTPSPRRRLSGPVQDANEDYHDFIESVGKATSTPVFEQKSRRRQRLPVGTSRLLDHGRIRLIPFPSANPKDPLNLPAWRKWAAVVAMSMFGALAIATEVSLGSLLLIFSLEYAGVNPNAVQNATFASTPSLAPAASINFTAALVPLLPAGASLPPVSRIQMLATVPLLTAAAASYVQVPLSEAVGRRPVLLLAAACAWAGALWAGVSSGTAGRSSAFSQHLGARALIGLGAGAVHALVPLVAAHDLFFLHQRHLALALSAAIQALVTVGFAAAAPHVAARFDWRWIYYIAAASGFLAWLALVALVPETRWTLRTKAQLCGGGCGGDLDTCVYADENERRRGAIRLGEHYGYSGRTLWTDVGLFVVSPFGAWQWARAGRCVLDLVRVALLPPVLWVAVVQAVLLVASRAAAELTADTILRSGAGGFSQTGLVAVAWAVAGVLTAVLGGLVVGSRFSLAVTRHLRAQQSQQSRRHSMLPRAERKALGKNKRRPVVRREAEHNLPGLALPLVLAIAGCFFFGAVLYRDGAAADVFSWTVASLVAASAFLTTALLLFSVGSSVYLIESYPMWAGPCLVHANSLPLVAAFFLSSDGSGQRSRTASLVATKGALEGWAVLAEVLIVLSLGLPALFFGGRWLRAWAAGTVQGGGHGESVESVEVGDASSKGVTSGEPSTSTPFSMTTASTTFDYTASPSHAHDTYRQPRYTAPHPGTRADIPSSYGSITESVIAGRAL